MYLYGASLPFKIRKPINIESKISISYHGNDNNFFCFLQKIKEKYPNYTIVPQGIRALRLLYAGDQIIDNSIHDYYVKTENDYSYRQGKIRMFLNVLRWIEFLKGFDFGIGSCIHGSIASILAGNPTVLISSDSRTRELAEYHYICSIPIERISEVLSLEDIYSEMDFDRVLINHKKNYLNYISFLETNNINIDKNVKEGYILKSFFDEVASENGEKRSFEVKPYLMLEQDEQLERLQSYSKICKGKMNWWEKRSGTESKEYLNWEKSFMDTKLRLNRLTV